MAGSSQQRAVKNYRDRLSERGMARFEVVGLDSDRGLIRSLARRLAQGDAEAARIRAVVSRSVTGETSTKGGLIRALRNSPLVDADLDLKRLRVSPRKIDL
jgi:hypothetical protein